MPAPVQVPVPMSVNDLAEHISTVIAILGIVFAALNAAGAFILYRIWKNIDELHDDVKESLKSHYECKVALPFTYVSIKIFEQFHKEWTEFLKERKSDWSKYWGAFNGHKHDKENGDVIRRDET